jgi:flagellar basal body-associated protein FliL
MCATKVPQATFVATEQRSRGIRKRSLFLMTMVALGLCTLGSLSAMMILGLASMTKSTAGEEERVGEANVMMFNAIESSTESSKCCL